MKLAPALDPRRIYRGWYIATAAAMGSGLAIGTGQYAFGLFVAPLEETFGWSRTEIGASLSFLAVGSIAAPFLGRLMDRHGARPVLFFCLSLMILSFALRPFMTSLWQWYALSFLQFFGYIGVTILPMGRLIGVWFSRTRGRVLGIAGMGNNFGGLVVPLIVGATMAQFTWRGSYVALAIMSAFVLIFGLIVIREFPKENSRGEPGGVGTNGDAISLTGRTVREAIRTKAFYAVTTAVLMGAFTYTAALPQVVVHLTDQGVSVSIATLTLSFLAAFGMLGKVSMGLLSERIGSRYALMFNLEGQAFFLVLMIWAKAPVIMWISVPMFGFFLGGFGALFQLIVQDTFGMRHFGSIMGIINLATIVSFGAGPFLAGRSFDLTGSYNAAFIITAVLFSIGALALTQARVREQGA